MLVRLVASLVFLGFSTGFAAAASFDCGKAETPFERAICDSPELSKQDEILARSYATALGGLSKEAADAVKAGQRGWLAFARRACTDDAQPISRGDYTEEQAQCLDAIFRSRINVLAEGRMRSGRRVYSIDTYAVMADPDATEESWNKVATKEFSTARIDGTDDEAEAFNAIVAALNIGTYEGEAGGSAMDDASSDNQARVEIDNIGSRRITLVVNDWWYGHGAAHGNYTISYVHFLTEEARQLEASDIFTGDGWEDALAELSFEALQQQLGADGLFIDAPSDLRDTVSSPASWNFADDGLLVRFQPYDVTAYAAGAPVVTIPWDSINEFMTDDGRAIAATY